MIEGFYGYFTAFIGIWVAYVILEVRVYWSITFTLWSRVLTLIVIKKKNLDDLLIYCFGKVGPGLPILEPRKTKDII